MRRKLKKYTIFEKSESFLSKQYTRVKRFLKRFNVNVIISKLHYVIKIYYICI